MLTAFPTLPLLPNLSVVSCFSDPTCNLHLSPSATWPLLLIVGPFTVSDPSYCSKGIYILFSAFCCPCLQLRGTLCWAIFAGRYQAVPRVGHDVVHVVPTGTIVVPLTLCGCYLVSPVFSTVFYRAWWSVWFPLGPRYSHVDTVPSRNSLTHVKHLRHYCRSPTTTAVVAVSSSTGLVLGGGRLLTSLFLLLCHRWLPTKVKILCMWMALPNFLERNHLGILT